MARIEPKDGKYRLGGSNDADLEGIDGRKYNVFTDEEKLREAKERYPDYHWFASYTITDKKNKVIRDLPEDYTLRLDRPDAKDFQLYYYFEGKAHPFSYEDSGMQGEKKRIKAKLKIGDPPTGHYP